MRVLYFLNIGKKGVEIDCFISNFWKIVFFRLLLVLVGGCFYSFVFSFGFFLRFRFMRVVYFYTFERDFRFSIFNNKITIFIFKRVFFFDFSFRNSILFL